MVITTINASQRQAAKVVGLSYLLAIPLALFAEFYVGGQLIYNTAASVDQNIKAHEQLFRLGIASNITVFAIDVILVTALFVVLKPVNRNLALLAAFWRIIETAILVVILLNDFSALRILDGSDSLGVFKKEQLQALARLSLGAHGTGYNVGLLFAGFGSTLFCYLWFTSNFIPKALAGFGVLSSLILVVCMYVLIISSRGAEIVSIYYYGAPIFIFELTMGFWLLIKGINVKKAVGEAERLSMPHAVDVS